MFGIVVVRAAGEDRVSWVYEMTAELIKQIIHSELLLFGSRSQEGWGCYWPPWSRVASGYSWTRPNAAEAEEAGALKPC